MKNRNHINPFFRMFSIGIVFIFMMLIIWVGLFYYVFAIPEPEGLSLASWPNTFTDNFSLWLDSDHDKIFVKEKGLSYLDEYGLWLQVIDDSGEEVFSYHKPDNYPTKYLANQLIELNTSLNNTENTIFTGNYEDSKQTYSYIIGFPYAIGKHMIYYNGTNVSRLSPVFQIGVVCAISVIFVYIIVYGLWLSKHMEQIIKGIRNISLRNYIPLKAKGLFSNVYFELDELNDNIYRSDKIQKDTERVRKEWIANITHDLKTPLSPIKGYAEMLVENPNLESQTVEEYGKIILKNVIHTENLINDLKTTYQLDAGVISLDMQSVHLVRFVRELVIDIINDPVFSHRDIEFESHVKDMIVDIDVKLFRRAIGNLVINALVHNPKETKVIICIDLNEHNECLINISDNGMGMSDEQQLEVFERYYRGTNTQEKSEGSGLGLAIAKQIIVLHNGRIDLKSRLNEGSQFIITLPIHQ